MLPAGVSVPYAWPTGSPEQSGQFPQTMLIFTVAPKFLPAATRKLPPVMIIFIGMFPPRPSYASVFPPPAWFSSFARLFPLLHISSFRRGIKKLYSSVPCNAVIKAGAHRFSIPTTECRWMNFYFFHWQQQAEHALSSSSHHMQDYVFYNFHLIMFMAYPVRCLRVQFNIPGPGCFTNFYSCIEEVRPLVGVIKTGWQDFVGSPDTTVSSPLL